ncbi:RHS repeat-associated core domain-containing protein [Pseudomonas sp. 20GA0080]|uniref:RHS repeat-associated core domain-containing protein n=1 Tax=Pseudomonas alliivorans TaxID=2810613 RepID=UPI001AE5413E|nr:RHS repeat-associated core domain-containing protein [Pseudomonas alliivorans]MBP0953204.1 RHS repeat-associated core domain-containing protein [Pseudomonas alliivorans]
MSSIAQVQLCRYHYDAVDRLARSELQGQISLKLFYEKNRLTTHIQGHTQRTLLHADEQLLALRVGQNQTTTCVLLATDQQSSVIATPGEGASFTPYGHRHPQANSMSLPGFNGQQADRVTGHYLLGNGYRAFNPVLMRFNSPDRLSPFGEGGLNAYAYCAGDPINLVDPEGHLSFPAAVWVLSAVQRFRKRPYAAWLAPKMRYITTPISTASETLPSLQTLSFSAVRGETLDALKNTVPYKNVIRKFNAEFGRENLERFVLKGGNAKESVAQWVETAIAGNGKGFLPEMALPYRQAPSHSTNSRAFNDIDQGMLEIRGLDYLTHSRKRAVGRRYGPRDSDTSD